MPIVMFEREIGECTHSQPIVKHDVRGDVTALSKLNTLLQVRNESFGLTIVRVRDRYNFLFHFEGKNHEGLMPYGSKQEAKNAGATAYYRMLTTADRPRELQLTVDDLATKVVAKVDYEHVVSWSEVGDYMHYDKVATFLRSTGNAPSYVRLRPHIVADVLIAAKPYLATLVDLPATVSDEQAFGALWSKVAQPQDLKAYEDSLKDSGFTYRKAIISYLHRRLARLSHMDALRATYDIFMGEIEYDHLAEQFVCDIGDAHLFSTGLQSLYGLLATVETGPVFEWPRALALFVGNHQHVFAAEQAAANRLAHATNGNTTRSPVIKRLEVDRSTQYFWQDLPSAVPAIHYYQYLDAPGVAAIDASVEVVGDGTMVVKCAYGFIDDMPDSADSRKAVGYMWFSSLTAHQQAEYIDWLKAQETGSPAFATMVLPTIDGRRFQGYAEYQGRIRHKSQVDGYAAAMQASANRRAHSTNGNQVKVAKTLKEQKPKTDKKKEKKDAKPKPKPRSTVVARINPRQTPLKPRSEMPVVRKTEEHQTPHQDRLTQQIEGKLRNDVMYEKCNVGNVKRIAMNIVLPDLSNTMLTTTRYAGEFEDDATATANPTRRINVTIAPATDGLNLKNPDGVFIFKRDLHCSLIYYDANPTGNTMQYNYAMYGQNIVPGPAAIPTTLCNITPVGWFDPEVAYAVPQYSYTPHGSYWYPHRDTQRDSRMNWFHCTAGSSFNMQVAGIGNQSVVGFSLYVDNAGTPEIVASTAQVIGSGVLAFNPQVPVSGYYACRILYQASASSAGAATLVVSITNLGKSVMAHLPAVDFNLNSARFTESRILGASGMFSNFANLFNVQGYISGVTLPGDRSWCEVLSTLDNTKMLSLTNTTIIGQEQPDNGCRVWLRPVSDADYQLNPNTPPTYQNVSSSQAPGFAPLYSTSEYGIIYYQNVSGSTISGMITDSKRVEYLTNDTWADNRMPTTNTNDWHMAHECLKHVPTVTSNPAHLYILSKALLSGIANYAEPIGKWTARLAKALNQLY